LREVVEPAVVGSLHLDEISLGFLISLTWDDRHDQPEGEKTKERHLRLKLQVVDKALGYSIDHQELGRGPTWCVKKIRGLIKSWGVPEEVGANFEEIAKTYEPGYKEPEPEAAPEVELEVEPC
jgi:hypothetical protein